MYTYPGHHWESKQIWHASVHGEEDLTIPILSQNREVINNHSRESFYSNELETVLIII